MKVLFLLFLFYSLVLAAYPTKEKVRVVIMDTGLDIEDVRFKDLICGYRDFTGTGIQDNIGHGTHIAGIIKSKVKNENFCFIILKYINKLNDSTDIVNKNLNNLYYSLYQFNPDIVNFSGGGHNFLESESLVIRDLKNTKFFVAAGNENENIDIIPYYPASLSFSNIIPVAAIDSTGKKAEFSSWGKRVIWKNGVDVLSTVPYSINPSGYLYMSGTSMSTAKATSEYLNEYY